MSLGRTSTFLDIYFQRDMDRGILSEEGAQDEVKNIITGDQRPADAQSWEPDTVYAQQTVTVEA